MIVEAPLSEEQVQRLAELHRQLLALDGGTAMLEGDYAPRDQLVPTGTKGPVHWFRAGRLRGPDDMLSADNVANMRSHGIVVFGPAPSTLLPEVTSDDVRAAVREMMAEPADATTERDAALEILDLARSLRALETGEPTSRRAGLEWGLRSMGPRWHAALLRAGEVKAGAHVDDDDRTLRDALLELRRSYLM